jgi:hypothetical protein
MLSGNILGYEGIVVYYLDYNIYGFYKYVSVGNVTHDTLIALSGGLLTSITLFIILVLSSSKNPFFKWVITIMIIQQLVYSLFEANIIPNNINCYSQSLIAYSIGWALSLVIHLKSMTLYIMRDNKLMEVPQMFNFEKWLLKVSNCEDTDSWLHIFPRDCDGGFCLFDNENRVSGSGDTLEEACNNFESDFYKVYGFKIRE